MSRWIRSWRMKGEGWEDLSEVVPKILERFMRLLIRPWRIKYEKGSPKDEGWRMRRVLRTGHYNSRETT